MTATAAIPDPLALAALATLLAVALPRLRRRWPLWASVLGRVLLVGVLTVLVEAALGSPLAPRFGGDGSWRRLLAQLVEAGWWWALARMAVGLARAFVVLENRPRETRIVSDLVAGAISVATLLAIVNFAFEVPIRGLLATSGVIAIVLGLALQSTLADVFSGIAVGLERPYEPGDLLWVEGGIEGRVEQINWRSTQIRTGDSNIAVVPNSIIAKARLVNRSAPTPVRRATVELLLDPAAPSDRCFATLCAAVRSCRLMLDTPAPGVSCTALRGDGMLWEIGFSVPDTASLSGARDELLRHAHRHLSHAGIGLGVAGALPSRPFPEPPDLARILRQSDLFGVVPDAEREQLVPYFATVWLAAGEVVMQAGATPEAMFVIASGTVEIERNGRVVRRMSPGESLGAVGLITGTPIAITATALTEARLYRIDREALSSAIRDRPSIALALEELARRGQDALRRAAEAAEQSDEPVRPEMFLGRLRALLHALAS